MKKKHLFKYPPFNDIFFDYSFTVLQGVPLTVPGSGIGVKNRSAQSKTTVRSKRVSPQDIYVMVRSKNETSSVPMSVHHCLLDKVSNFFSGITVASVWNTVASVWNTEKLVTYIEFIYPRTVER